MSPSTAMQINPLIMNQLYFQRKTGMGFAAMFATSSLAAMSAASASVSTHAARAATTTQEASTSEPARTWSGKLRKRSYSPRSTESGKAILAEAQKIQLQQEGNFIVQAAIAGLIPPPCTDFAARVFTLFGIGFSLTQISEMVQDNFFQSFLHLTEPEMPCSLGASPNEYRAKRSRLLQWLICDKVDDCCGLGLGVQTVHAMFFARGRSSDDITVRTRAIDDLAFRRFMLTAQTRHPRCVDVVFHSKWRGMKEYVKLDPGENALNKAAVICRVKLTLLRNSGKSKEEILGPMKLLSVQLFSECTPSALEKTIDCIAEELFL